MKKILAFVGSNHTQSINRQLAEYAATKLDGSQVDVLDLTNFEAPLYSIDIEKSTGHPESVKTLFDRIQIYDAYIIVSPEHNGLMPAVLKNTIDWLTRVEGKFLGNKPVVLMSTSPGGLGGANNLKIMSQLLPWWGGELIDTYSLGSFMEKFDTTENKITDTEEENRLISILDKLLAA